VARAHERPDTQHVVERDKRSRAEQTEAGEQCLVSLRRVQREQRLRRSRGAGIVALVASIVTGSLWFRFRSVLAGGVARYGPNSSN
jgi:hypothetical protein